MVERLWRTVMYAEVYLRDYRDPLEAEACLEGYLEYYNHDRLYQSLGYRTLTEVYHGL